MFFLGEEIEDTEIVGKSKSFRNENIERFIKHYASAVSEKEYSGKLEKLVLARNFNQCF